MSNNIDKRVVQMEFDNAEFERRVRVTQKSIDGLKDNWISKRIFVIFKE